MKHLKKMMALVIAMVMVLSMTSMAWATTPTPTNNQTLDGSISVLGLEAGDTVTFYQVLEFDQDAVTTGGWSKTTAFASLTEAQIQTILGIALTNGKYIQTDTSTGTTGAYGISAEMAGTIAAMANSYTAAAGDTTQIYTVTATAAEGAVQANPEGGLYVAIIHPAKAGVIYNPVFVGADYDGDNTSHTFTVVNMTDTYSDQSMAKKETLTVEKDAYDPTSNDNNNKETVKVGDTLTFTVKTTIPEFADNYTAPVFYLTDILSEGLELVANSVKVYDDAEKAITPENAANTQVAELGKTFGNSQKSYTVNENKDKNATDINGYSVVFEPAYLKSLTAAKNITVVYQAKVTDLAVTSVNIEENTVQLNYSNEPTDTEGHGVLIDKTKHYTFDIDANLLGETSYHNTEVVKVGLDKDGKEITETRALSNGHSVGALQGAKFKLYVLDSNGAVDIKDETGATKKATLYTNDIMTGDYYIESDVDGRLTIHGQTTPGIRGLDAGTYYLVETEAPAGYIKAQNGVKIDINATIDNTHTETKYLDTTTGTLYDAQNAQETLSEVTYTVPILTSYEVKINGKQTAEYTMTNEKPDQGDKDTPADTAVGENGLIGANGASADADAGKITNTQGTELPSTGGIGTTLFYIIGAILVLGAGILLVTRRRMNAN